MFQLVTAFVSVVTVLVSAPYRDPEGRSLRGPADRGEVHVPRHRQRLLGQTARGPKGEETVS